MNNISSLSWVIIYTPLKRHIKHCGLSLRISGSQDRGHLYSKRWKPINEFHYYFDNTFRVNVLFYLFLKLYWKLINKLKKTPQPGPVFVSNNALLLYPPPPYFVNFFKANFEIFLCRIKYMFLNELKPFEECHMIISKRRVINFSFDIVFSSHFLGMAV